MKPLAFLSRWIVLSGTNHTTELGVSGTNRLGPFLYLGVALCVASIAVSAYGRSGVSSQGHVFVEGVKQTSTVARDLRTVREAVLPSLDDVVLDGWLKPLEFSEFEQAAVGRLRSHASGEARLAIAVVDGDLESADRIWDQMTQEEQNALGSLLIRAARFLRGSGPYHQDFDLDLAFAPLIAARELAPGHLGVKLSLLLLSIRPEIGLDPDWALDSFGLIEDLLDTAVRDGRRVDLAQILAIRARFLFQLSQIPGYGIDIEDVLLSCDEALSEFNVNRNPIECAAMMRLIATFGIAGEFDLTEAEFENYLDLLDESFEIADRKLDPIGWAYGQLLYARLVRLGSDEPEEQKDSIALDRISRALLVLSPEADLDGFLDCQLLTGEIWVEAVYAETASSAERAQQAFEHGMAAISDESLERQLTFRRLFDLVWRWRIESEGLDGRSIEPFELALTSNAEAMMALMEMDWDRHVGEWAQYQIEVSNSERDRAIREGDLEVASARQRIESARARVNSGKHPEIWAKLTSQLAYYLCHVPQAEGTAHMDRAVRLFSEARGVLNPRTHPGLWAEISHGEADVWNRRIDGDRQSNLMRVVGLQRSILLIYDESYSPIQWAQAQNNLGRAWIEVEGDNYEESVEKAIECYEAALRVRTRDDMPYQWAKMQTNLSEAWFRHPGANRDVNLDRALTHARSGLSVWKRHEHPVEWFRLTQMLGDIYEHRASRGSSPADLLGAIRAREALLNVITVENAPDEWSIYHSSLARLYTSYGEGNRAESLVKAIEHWREFQSQISRESSPDAWAEVHTSIAGCWFLLGKTQPVTERGEAMRQCIASHSESLAVYEWESHPEPWIKAHNSIGLAWVSMSEADPQECLSAAMASYEAALAVLDREEDSVSWASTRLNWGVACWQAKRRELDLGDARSAMIEAAASFRRGGAEGQYRQAIGLLRAYDREFSSSR